MNALRALMLVFAVSAAGVWTSVVVLAQTPADPAGSAKQETPGQDRGAQRVGMDELKRTAARYRIIRDADPAKSLDLVPEPVLHWTNPLRRTFAGASFVWVADGRPEVVASIYRFNEGGQTVEDDEFQSLSTTTLTAARGGDAVWTPRTPGVTLAPIPGAPKPAATAAERLRQMQALAREFHAFFDLPNEQSELRLLPKPIYRYQSSRPDLLDGALFAFVQTTDPEVLLSIEARPNGADSVWQFALARMSMVNVRAEHKDRPVWKVDWAHDLTNPNEPYVTLRAPDLGN
jgi:hypothetical protein